jgi:hypothetical protein
MYYPVFLMSTFVIEYQFDSFHPACLCSTKPFPHRYTFEITSDSLSMDHEFKVEFATFAKGPRSYTIRAKLNGHGTINQIEDVTSITLIHHYKKVSDYNEKLNQSVIGWEKEISAHEKIISDLTMQKYEISDKSEDQSSDQSSDQSEDQSLLLVNIDEKIKEHVEKIKSIKTGKSEIEFSETVYANEITLPRYMRGNMTNFAKDLYGTFWWYPSTHPTNTETWLWQNKEIDVVA